MTQAIVAIAKNGINVETATDPNDFIFHSSYNTFKIIAEGTKSISLTASTTNQSFNQAHGLDYIPVVAAFAKRSTASQVFAPNGYDVELYGAGLGFTGDVVFNYVQSDATNVTFNFDNNKGSTVSVSIRYFLLEKIEA